MKHIVHGKGPPHSGTRPNIHALDCQEVALSWCKGEELLLQSRSGETNKVTSKQVSDSACQSTRGTGMKEHSSAKCDSTHAVRHDHTADDRRQLHSKPFSHQRFFYVPAQPNTPLLIPISSPSPYFFERGGRGGSEKAHRATGANQRCYRPLH